MADVLRCLRLFVFAFVLALVPSAVEAHAAWVSTDPGQGAKLKKLPVEAVVTFAEAPTTAAVLLNQPDGTMRKLKAEVKGDAVHARLPGRGPRGVYALSWRVVSDDGHPVAGSSTFSVTTGPAAANHKQDGRPSNPANVRSGGSRTPILLGVAVLAILSIGFAARSLRR